ncbi:MAG: hypothetical protein FVQ77_17125 [Cytophagales bacterium]|nr:hypothetical protein [Cytophagales bacterium]
MLDIYKENISIDKLRQVEERLKIQPNSSDFISYTEFLKYFRNLKTIKKHNLIIGINFTYGWMPTIFHFRPDKLNEATHILNSAKLGQIPSVNDLQVLKECFNNSLVGTSKLLHFINPTKFAIWDSRVYRYLTNQKPYSYRLDNYNAYLDFLKFCDFISSNTAFESIHSSLIKKVGYTMTRFRTVELIMYNGGGP